MLKGCIKRTMEEKNILNMEGKIALEYDHDKIAGLADDEELEKQLKSGQPYTTTTTSSKKESIKVEFFKGKPTRPSY